MKREKKGFVLFMIGALFFIALNGVFAAEQEYPTREISLYVGFPPGGSGDVSARVIAKVLEKKMGVPVLVVNKPGADGAVAASFIANAKPDGYTLIYMFNPSTLMKKIEEPTLTYGPENLTMLGSFYSYYTMLTVRCDAPYKTFEEFVDFGKKNDIKFGSGDAMQQIIQVLLTDRLGIKTTIVPFNGGGPTIRALLGGHIDGVTISTGPTGPHVKSGELRWLAYLGPKRNKVYPDIPSFKEKGQDVYIRNWLSFVGPKGIPESITRKLENTLKETLQSDEIESFFSQYGWEYEYHSPADCVVLWETDTKFFEGEMKKLGLKK
jgi:tripartite-type tricarboxylate transporter receptor subunit TctC